jgi:ribosome-associated toxin RatA of RatAB toxin-antitoxin module
MREVHRSAILPYPGEAMFDLVADVDAYAQFLPWCTASQIVSTGPAADASDDGYEVVARLGLSQGQLKGAFTTRNCVTPPRSIRMDLIEGPFSALSGEWRFESLGEDGSKLMLDMQFSFSNPLKDLLLGAVFEHTCNQLVDAFVQRAREKYAG